MVAEPPAGGVPSIAGARKKSCYAKFALLLYIYFFILFFLALGNLERPTLLDQKLSF
jgi:hypothetical protein